MTDMHPEAHPELTLEDRIDALACTPQLLVACDYDGTLAPIVDDPDAAFPLREAIVALRMLVEQPETHVAVISGRALSDLAAFTSLPETVHLVGSHGSEFDPGFAESMTDEQRAILRDIHQALSRLAEQAPGFTIESKPASVAFHYRSADPADARRTIDEITKGPASIRGVHVKRGKMVLELSVVGTDKGAALQAIRQRVGAHAVLFLGDDVTDEDAFETLRGPDVGVKVGDGDSAAAFRVRDPRAVARLLARLSERRAAWLCGEGAVPVDHHSMLSDQRTIALLTPEARVTWLCAPRIDSPALFAELIGGPSAGYFAIRSEDGSPARSQRYLDGSLVVATAFGDFEVTDYLDCSGGRPRQRAGRSDLVRVISGEGRVVVEFAPRLDFGRVPTHLGLRDNGIDVLDSPDPIVLYSPGVEWTIQHEGIHETAVATVELGDEPLVLSLRIGTGTLRAPIVGGDHRLDQTVAFWRSWHERLELPTLARAQVERSALILRGLVHGPTGGIAAAGTTSLPETIGGVRNWDYRYCWPRDAAIAATALVKLGSQDEAMHLLDWLLGVVERAVSPDRTQPLYTVSGDELTTEGEIGELSGYSGSRPVRIGNAASRQVQLDVFGPVVELVYTLAMRDAPLTPLHWRVVEAMVSAVDTRWREPDHGIWELRSRRQSHVHSKVMCWLTIDRAIKSACLLRDRVPEGWESLRQAIADDVLERGWKEHIGAFTASYEHDDLDAAALCVGLSGLLPPDDQRFVRTVDAIEGKLGTEAGVYRYKFDDGLPGVEGVFHLCTCWLIQCDVLLGRRDKAKALFERYLELVGPTGLMSEEYSPNAGLALGNHPQVYSHAGLIECALALGRP